MLRRAILEDSLRGAMLHTRQIILPLTLHALNGRTVRAWDFKQKKNLVIAFLDADCAECAEYVRRIAAHAADLREREAVALLVFLEAPARALTEPLPQEIIAGSDMPGRGVRAFLGEDALSSRGLERRGVFVIDRYGELYEQWIVAGHEVPGPGEILSALDQIEIACEECAVPLWPSD